VVTDWPLLNFTKVRYTHCCFISACIQFGPNLYSSSLPTFSLSRYTLLTYKDSNIQIYKRYLSPLPPSLSWLNSSVHFGFIPTVCVMCSRPAFGCSAAFLLSFLVLRSEIRDAERVEGLKETISRHMELEAKVDLVNHSKHFMWLM
jgi:hypothetical protein